MDTFLVVILAFSVLAAISGFVFLKLKEKKVVNNLQVYGDRFITADGKTIFYKDINLITLKAAFYSGIGWEPKLVILYSEDGYEKEKSFTVDFYGVKDPTWKLTRSDYLPIETILRIRQILPYKLGRPLLQFLSNETILFESLEQERIEGVELIKPQGSFRLKK